MKKRGSKRLLAMLLAVVMVLPLLPAIGMVEANAASFTTKINGTTRSFTEGVNVGGHYSAGCVVAAGQTTWSSTNSDSGHYCCFNNATSIYQEWWGSTPDHHYDNFLWDVPETPNTTDNMKKWLSVAEPGSRVTIGNTYGNYNGHTVIYLGVDPSDSNYMWIINTNGHGYGLNPVERVSWSYLPTYLGSSYSKIISIQWPGAASEYSSRMAPHVHSYTQYVYYLADHPHYKCYQCSCGDVKENLNEPTYVPSCEICNPPACSITYDANGGSGAPAKQTYTYAPTGTTALASGTPIREGYTFQGWSLEKNATTSTFAAGQNWELSKKGDYTLYAVWKIVPVTGNTEFSQWVDEVPEVVNAETYDIETKTVYRYRDQTSETVYGDWTPAGTTETRPTESDTLRITGTQTYYNYYHYCCNWYDNAWNVDSISYGSGYHYYHTIRTTYQLSAMNLGDMGGKQFYQSDTPCSQNFYAYVQADDFETYEYTYETRTKTTNQVSGEWSEWEETQPAEANGRTVEQMTLYRYKLKDASPIDPPTPTDPPTPIDPPTPVDPAAPQIVVDSKTVTAGREFEVTVSVKNNPGFMVLTLTPAFSDKLSLVKAENGTLVSDLTAGKKYVWTANADTAQDGVLLKLTFTTDEALAPGDYTVSFTVWDSSNAAEEDVGFTVVPGVVTVIDFIWGDANGDFVVNSKDIVRLKNFFANLDDETGLSTVELFPGADANGDGTVNSKDIVRLKNYLANLDDETGLSTVILGPAA